MLAAKHIQCVCVRAFYWPHSPLDEKVPVCVAMSFGILIEQHKLMSSKAYDFDIEETYQHKENSRRR